MSAAVYAVGDAVYVMFASGEEQEFNKVGGEGACRNNYFISLECLE